MQAKRIAIGVGSVVGGVDTGVNLEVPSTLREEVNFHNIWASFGAEPLTADANAQGSWILFVERKNQAAFTWTDANINTQEMNQVIIACGVWVASNQTPVNVMVNPKTSRNLGAGDRLQMIVHVAGVTAGSVLVRTMLCAHVIRK